MRPDSVAANEHRRWLLEKEHPSCQIVQFENCVHLLSNVRVSRPTLVTFEQRVAIVTADGHLVPSYCHAMWMLNLAAVPCLFDLMELSSGPSRRDGGTRRALLTLTRCTGRSQCCLQSNVLARTTGRAGLRPKENRNDFRQFAFTLTAILSGHTSP
jgi:hypothetical protein